MIPSVEPFDEAKYKALMDGIQSAEIRLKDVRINEDFRFDSGFYTIKTARNVTLSYELIGKHLLSTQYGVSKDMNSSGEGYQIFRMNELHHGLCDIEPEKYVELSENDFEIVELHDRDVLFNRTNSYDLVGRTGIYYQHGSRQTFASYLVRLVPDNTELLSEYLVAFLNTKHGVQEIKRRARQSINQTNVNPEEVKRIQIPMVCMELQQTIKAVFLKADILRVHANDQYEEAERIIDQTIGRIEYIETIPAVSEKCVSASFALTGRLDAEYYQQKYLIIRNNLHTKDTVQSICSRVYDDNYIPQGDVEYNYIELANVGNNGDISDVGIVLGAKLPSRARRIVKKGQVIISSVEGSLQSCALITDEYDGALCSTGFYVLDSSRINSETLLVLFKSDPIQALLKQRCSGTILTAISKDELLNMPLPYIDEDVQKEIAAKVQESFTLRRKSKELLEYAKQAVEMAIDQGEEAALEWLNSKVNI